MKIEALSLSDIALQLNAISDIETLLGYSVNAASVVSSCDFAAIMLPDHDYQMLHLAAHYSLIPHPILDFFSIPCAIKSTHAGYVLRTGEPTGLRPDYVDEYQSLEAHQLDGLVYLPLRGRVRTIGVLVLANWSALPLLPNTPQLNQLGALIGLAIENTNLYQESQRRSWEFALIIDATEAVSSTLSQSEVLTLISKNLFKAIPINWCEIFISDEQYLKTLLRHVSATWTDYPQSVFSWADIPHFATLLEQGQTYTYFYSSALEGYTPTEQSLVGDYGGSVLIPLQEGLLQIAWLETDWAQFQSTLKYLPQMGEEIARKIQEKNRALYLVHQLLRHTKTDSCRLWLRHGDGFQLVLDQENLIWNRQAFAPSHRLQDFPLAHIMIWGEREILSYHRQGRDIPLGVQSYLEAQGLQRLLMIPFVIQNAQNGLIILGSSDHQGSFGVHEINLAQGLVLQAVNALRNAQFYEELQQSVAELRRAQARLVQTARLSAVGELAAAVVHQINNPLATILGDAELLLSDLPPNSSAAASAQAILRAGQHAKEVVRRLLSVARQKSPQEKPDLMDINLSIQNTISLVRATLKQSRIELKSDLQADLPWAYGLAGQLEDVWLNLILNARDAVRGVTKPRIGIQSILDTKEGFIKVIVWDNGLGLGDVDVHRLFEAFYTTKPQGEGTGLGLYICASVIEKCHGNIKVGLSPAGGAMFTVSLPTQIAGERTV